MDLPALLAIYPLKYLKKIHMESL